MMRSHANLYKLAQSGQTDMLLHHLAEPEMADDIDAKNWALIAAAEANQLDVVLVLLSIGANIEGASQRQCIHPLWKAAKQGHLDMIKLLVSHGVDISATDNRGLNAIGYARRYNRAAVVAYLEQEMVSRNALLLYSIFVCTRTLPIPNAKFI